MKITARFQILIVLVLLPGIANAQVAVGTAFTYQGSLTAAGVPLDGVDAADLRFTLYTAGSGGSPVAGPGTVNPVTVNGVDFLRGVFSVDLDFGGAAFTRDARWVAVEVSVPPGGPYTLLAPRQRITAAPVAQIAGGVLTSVTYNNRPVDVINEGLAGAAAFGINNVSNTAAAVTASTNGPGYAVHATAPASGYAGYFDGRAYVSQNLGVGTTSPNFQLSLGSSLSHTKIALYETSPTNHYGMGVVAGQFSFHLGGSGARYAFYDSDDLTNELVTIKGTGEVGIGTTSPGNAKLYVRSSSTANYAIGVLGELDSAVTGIGSAGVRGYNGGLRSECIDVGGWSAGVWGTARSSNLCTGFGVYGTVEGTNGTGVAGEGHVGVYGASTSGNGYAGYFYNGRVYVDYRLGIGAGSESSTFQLQCSDNSAAKPTSGSWTISSDARLKKNVQTLTGSFERLLRLRGVSYQWIDPATQGNMTGTYTGLIAQEVEPVFPEWIGVDAKGYKTLTVIGFEGLVVEALRELRAEKDQQIAMLQKQVIDEAAAHAQDLRSLRAENAEMRARLARIESALTAAQTKTGNISP